MSSTDLRPLVLASAFALGSACGSPAVGSVDTEQMAVDIQECVAAESDCQHNSAVSGVESLVPGATNAVRISQGGQLDAPLLRPSSTARLAYLAVGLRGVGEVADPRTVSLTVSGSASISMSPLSGFRRVELDFANMVPPPLARVQIAAQQGAIDVVYVVGRWKNP